MARDLLARSRASVVITRRRGGEYVEFSDGPETAVIKDTGVEVIRGVPALPSDVCVRAAAVVARAELEAAVAGALAGEGVAVGGASMRSRLIVWAALAADQQRPREAAMLWADLSAACHLHAFEYPPNVAEVERLVERTSALCSV